MTTTAPRHCPCGTSGVHGLGTSKAAVVYLPRLAWGAPRGRVRVGRIFVAETTETADVPLALLAAEKCTFGSVVGHFRTPWITLLLGVSRLGVDHGGCRQGTQGEKNCPHSHLLMASQAHVCRAKSRVSRRSLRDLVPTACTILRLLAGSCGYCGGTPHIASSALDLSLNANDLGHSVCPRPFKHSFWRLILEDGYGAHVGALGCTPN
jgi:hypothetical protein